MTIVSRRGGWVPPPTRPSWGGLPTRQRHFAHALVLLTLVAGCGASQRERRPMPDPLQSVEAEELYRRGEHFAQSGDYTRAEQYLTAAIERGYPEGRALPLLLQVCVEASRLVSALAYAEPYLERHPEEWPLRMLVASIHMGLEHATQARELLERVLADAPDEPAQAHYFLGVLLRDDLDDRPGAQEHFRRYLALAPDGDHRAEALAALPPEERGTPIRIESGSGQGPERVVEPQPPPGAPERVEEPVQ
jgi:tetratricopeptide (TPR) repeat protein